MLISIKFDVTQIIPISLEIFDCTWSEWETFACDKSCGGGKRNKMRTMISINDSEEKCEGKEFVTEICNNNECPEDSDAT